MTRRRDLTTAVQALLEAHQSQMPHGDAVARWIVVEATDWFGQPELIVWVVIHDSQVETIWSGHHLMQMRLFIRDRIEESVDLGDVTLWTRFRPESEHDLRAAG